VSSLRRLRNLIGFALIALCLATPAMAWNFHQLAHQDCPVAFDVHHYHDGANVVIQDEAIPADGHRGQGDDHGHDHMLSLLWGVCGMLPEAIFLAPPWLERLEPQGLVARLPADRIEAPPPRPPRTA
jgi:hypothetical protein